MNKKQTDLLRELSEKFGETYYFESDAGHLNFLNGDINVKVTVSDHALEWFIDCSSRETKQSDTTLNS